MTDALTPEAIAELRRLLAVTGDSSSVSELNVNAAALEHHVADALPALLDMAEERDALPARVTELETEMDDKVARVAARMAASVKSQSEEIERLRGVIEKWYAWMRCPCRGCCWRQEAAIEAVAGLIERGAIEEKSSDDDCGSEP